VRRDDQRLPRDPEGVASTEYASIKTKQPEEIILAGKVSGTCCSGGRFETSHALLRATR